LNQLPEVFQLTARTKDYGHTVGINFIKFVSVGGQ
jgi:hypothetical protein